MCSLKKFKILIFTVAVFLTFQIVFSSNYLFSGATTRRAVSRYFEDRFEINIPALPTSYDNVSSNLENVSIEIDDTKLIINDLVPDQVYNDVEIVFYDNLGRKYEIILNNVITSHPTKADNKFVYDVYTNGLGRKPDHNGFKYWYNALSTFNVTAVDFVKEMINSDEFSSIYIDDSEKINALYRVVLGRDSDEEGFNYWKSRFLNLVDEMNIDNRQAILQLVDEITQGDEFKDLIKKSGFLYKV